MKKTMDKILKNISLRRKTVILFLAILALGIFLRTWHFSDWMVFNPDQARDTMLVQDVLAGKESALLMGPEVGNEHFGLGSWFYHLEILSAKIFGSDPWKLAIPDLLFSLLTIPLFYMFVRKYFSTNLSLAVTFFLSISYFMVRYSRFAFNPNSIPFFVLLFLLGVLYFLGSDKKKSLWGAAGIGVGIGVGMQLHILLLFIMPTVTGLAIIYAFFKKMSAKLILSSVGVIIILIILMNTGQILYEFNNGWSNSKKFFKVTTQTAGDSGGEGNKYLTQDVLCHMQANLHIATSLGDSEECEFYSAYERLNKYGMLADIKTRKTIPLIALSAIFTLGGYWLLF